MSEAIKDRILYEDNHLLIVNKRSGELVQGDRTGDKPLVEIAKDYIKTEFNKPGEVFLGIPHRIDRPTSGIIVFSRTSKSLSRMTGLFRDKEVEKRYWAIVSTKPPKNSGRLTNMLLRNPKQNKSYVHNGNSKDAKEAVLDYSLIGKSDRYYLLEINLHSGRHHQIRCQLANIGSPIKGDLKYGYDRSNKDASISLHARSISFIHPVKKEEIKIIAPTPKDVLWDYFQSQVS